MAKGFTLFSLKMKFSLYQQAEALIALIAIPFHSLFIIFFFYFLKADKQNTKWARDYYFFTIFFKNMIIYDYLCNTATCLQEDKYESLKLRKHLNGKYLLKSS